MAPPTKEEAIATLEEGRAALTELIDRLTEEEVSRSATLGDGGWSVKDLIGHISSWEELALRTLDEWRRPEVPWAAGPEGPFQDAPASVDRFNARTVEEKRSLLLREVRNRADDTHASFVSALGSMPDAEWRSEPFFEIGSLETLGDVLGSILAAPKRPFGHAFAHVPDLAEYVASVRRT